MVRETSLWGQRILTGATPLHGVFFIVESSAGRSPVESEGFWEVEDESSMAVEDDGSLVVESHVGAEEGEQT